MAVPVSIEIANNPITPGQSTELQINLSEEITDAPQTYSIEVTDPNHVLSTAVPVSITVGRGSSTGTVTINTQAGNSGHATFKYAPKKNVTATLDVAGL